MDCKGSDTERYIYITKANFILKKECEINNIKFFDIYNFITDEHGFLKKEYTIDNIHLDYNNDNLRTIIEDKIYELIHI